jgi:leader peptidase (prepilin peptidase) / N-methyltransferase
MAEIESIVLSSLDGADINGQNVRNMEILLAVIFGCIGASLGSFINVCADRLPADKSVVNPPSHCDACQRRLTALDLIPVFSFLVLRGRCRTCGARIPWRVFFVELGCGLFLGLLFWFKGLGADFGMIAFFFFVLVLIALIDLQTQLVLPVIVYPAIIVALLLDAFVAQRGIINSLEGAGVGAAIILVPVLVTRGAGMGLGDVEIAAFIGLATGFAEVIVGILGGIILGGVVAVFLVATRLKKRKDAIPFGPFLSLAAVVAILWGPPILQWYLNIFNR